MYNIAYVGISRICIYDLVEYQWYAYHLMKPSHSSIGLGQKVGTYGDICFNVHESLLVYYK